MQGSGAKYPLTSFCMRAMMTTQNETPTTWNARMNTQVQHDLPLLVSEWEQAKQKLDDAKAEELRLRNRIIAMFPSPVEGTNKLELPGVTVKYKHVINYSFDEATLAPTLNALPEPFRSQLVRYKPELNVKVYRILPKDALLTLSDTLITKPGQGSLEVVR